MQIVGPLGNAETLYAFWSDPSMDLSGKATGPFWSDDQGNSVQVSFDIGDGIAIDMVFAELRSVGTGDAHDGVLCRCIGRGVQIRGKRQC